MSISSEKLEAALAEVCLLDDGDFRRANYSVVIATLCDNYLDRSGAMLGRVCNLTEIARKERKARELKAAIEALEKELKETTGE